MAKLKKKHQTRQGASTKDSKTIIYTRFTLDNAIWLHEKKEETGHTLSHILNKLVESANLGKKFELAKKIPVYIVKAEQAKEKHHKKLQLLKGAGSAAAEVVPPPVVKKRARRAKTDASFAV